MTGARGRDGVGPPGAGRDTRRGQLDLFGGGGAGAHPGEDRCGGARPAGQGDDGALGPIPPPPPELVALGGRLPRGLRFGTSSWTFPGWRGLVYRRDYPNERSFLRESLAEYARHPLFGTVGIDRSFYAPLDPETAATYAARLPPGFPAVQKLWVELATWIHPRHPRLGPRAGARNERFLDPDLVADRVLGPLLAGDFRGHLGPLVIQVPPLPPGADPEPRAFADALDRFLRAAPDAVPWAVELRDRRLFTPRYLAVLGRHGATHVPTFWSRMPDLLSQWARAQGPTVDVRRPLVIRLMLPPGTRYEDLKGAYRPFDRVVAPQPEMRAQVAEIAQDALAAGVPEVHVLVNNKAEGSAPGTIAALAELLAAG